jgi:hypothetical protein
MFDDLLSSWRPLGQVSPLRLVDARLQIHWAAQVPASLGFTYGTPVPDYSHTSFSGRVDDGVFRLVSGSGPAGVRATLRIADLTLELFDAAGRPLDRMHLHGVTLDDAYAWLQEALATHAGGRRPLARPDHPLPDHPVASGAPFAYNETPAYDALERWFANALALLAHARSGHDPSPAIHIWPHHLDMAFLLVLDPSAPPEETRSIGVGMSPGDGSYTQPYFYVNHWPRADPSRLPDLPVGAWHTEGWIGAVFVGEAVAAFGSIAGQVDAVTRFVDAAVEASMRLLPED